MHSIYLAILLFLTGCGTNGQNSTHNMYIKDKTVTTVRDELVKKYGEKYRDRIIRGSTQLSKNWRKKDGTNEEFIKFCLDNYLDDSVRRSEFKRIQSNMETENGYMSKIRFRFNESDNFTDVKEGKSDFFFRKSVPVFDPYKEKLALYIQLNFPFYNLDEKRHNQKLWNREDWAMIRLGDYYAERDDPDFKAEAEEEVKEFQKNMGKYFSRMDHICMPDGNFPFKKALTLHCHFGLRDNLKEEYTRQGGLERQIVTGKLIEHILNGTIPVEFIKDTTTRWDPWKNKLFKGEPGKIIQVDYKTEGTKRYAGLLSEFKNKSSRDILYPKGSTFITRTFESSNFKSDEIESLIRSFLSDPVIVNAGKLISRRLGRPLQPFDIWYSGFQSQSFFPANMLDSITRTKYPTPASLQNDLPDILYRIGFPVSDASYIGAHAIVRPVVSGGFSDQPPMRGDTAVMTTVFNQHGLDYKAFRISMHELGHVVCGVYTTRDIDNFILADVPTSGLTEGIAEMLAYKNIEALGLKQGNSEEQKALLALATVWYMVDLGGQALNDIETWKWMYAHPGCTPEELKNAVLSISSEIWNKYYSSVFGGTKDQHILSIYNHFITGSLYLYNYFIGDLTMYQLYNAFVPGDLAEGLKKACAEGQTLPELWMENATGEGISLDPLLKNAREAIKLFDHNSQK